MFVSLMWMDTKEIRFVARDNERQMSDSSTIILTIIILSAQRLSSLNSTCGELTVTDRPVNISEQSHSTGIQYGLSRMYIKSRVVCPFCNPLCSGLIYQCFGSSSRPGRSIIAIIGVKLHRLLKWILLLLLPRKC